MEKIYYSGKLKTELSENSIRLQTGLPYSCGHEDFVRLGFYPVVDPMINSQVFFNPPEVYRINEDEKVAERAYTAPETNLEVVKSRALTLLEDHGRERLFESISQHPNGLMEVVASLVLNYPHGGSFVGRLSQEVEGIREDLEGVKSAVGIKQVEEILVKHGLFSVPR